MPEGEDRVSKPLTVECSIHVERRGKGARKQLEPGVAPLSPPPGRIPRVSRLMALALKFEAMVAAGEVSDYAELARLGNVTRARLSQIMSLVNLAPDIIEQILFLPKVERGRDPIILADLTPIAAELDWNQQRRKWQLAHRESGN
jgi:hypothetical protein